MSLPKIAGAMGRFAEGDAFFGREDVLGKAWDLLQTSNLRMDEPRRVGKSSLMNKMRVDAAARGYNALYLSIPDAEDELDFIRRLVAALRETDWAAGTWIDKFRSQLPGDLELVLKASLLELKAKNFDWRKPATELETILKSADSRTVLMIDELPLFIETLLGPDQDEKRAERFLLWLKRLRETFPPRWFFAGSIGLDSLVRRLKLSGSIADLQPLHLGAYTPEVAGQYLIGRGNYYNWSLSAETIDAILAAVEWPIPFYLNLVIEKLRDLVGEKQLPPSPQLVGEAIGRLISDGRTHFDHWDERLDRVFGPHLRDHCHFVLGYVSQLDGGCQASTIELSLTQRIPAGDERQRALRQVLDILISDGYFVREAGHIRFRSALLRRYWLETQA